MDINQEFQNLIAKLQQGERPWIKLGELEFQEIETHWKAHAEDKKELIPPLCLLKHSRETSPLFAPLLIQELKLSKDSEHLILVLNACENQIIQHAQRHGERIPYEFIQSLKRLLSTKEPELLEWTLRTIEQLGPQSIILKDSILSLKIGIKRHFNPHLKASSQIVEYITKRWSSV